MPINPIAKMNFMRKRLAHGIKRSGKEANAKKLKWVSNGGNLAEQRVHPLMIKELVDVKKHQLKNVRLEKAEKNLQNEIKKIQNAAKGKGSVANNKANIDIYNLKENFRLKYIINEQRTKQRKSRQANIVFDKLKSKGTIIPSYMEIDIHIYPNEIVDTYVEYMKKANKKYSELTKQDGDKILYEISNKIKYRKAVIP